MHLYIVVNCKSPNCRTVHVLMHLGERGKTPEKVEVRAVGERLIIL
jgi:hypothetical protein